MIKAEARVLIIEMDTYARSWTALLLARDWRTRIVGEVSTIEAAADFYSGGQAHKRGLPNLILVNADQNLPSAPQFHQALARLPGSPGVLLIGESVQPQVIGAVPFPGFRGYVLKPEIRYSLAWAIALAGPETWVITPSLTPFFRRPGTAQAGAAGQILVLNGHNPIHNFTEHEAETARMALIFSMERGEMSDEIKISKEWVYGLVSSIYRKLGMEEILNGEVDPAEYLGGQFAETPQVQALLRKTAGRKKGKDLETLAYHILTMPAAQPLD